MNNEEFRKSFLSSSNTPRNTKNASTTAVPRPSALGSKKSLNFGGATPRTVRGSTTGNVDFARQAREQHASSLVPNSVQQKKKYKSSAAPKGSKLGLGYTDRAKARQEAEDEDDKAERIKALEVQMKLGQIEPELFASLRDEIVGGDVGSTHLVKGLDRQLLARVRKGEDVMGGCGGRKKEEEDVGGGEEGSAEPEGNEDEELEKLAQREIKAVQREKVEKKGAMPTIPPPPIAGAKRSRKEIMEEFKTQRAAAASAKAAPVFDKSKWRRVDEGKREKTRTEIDRKGREVLIVIDKDGREKRMIKKPGQNQVPELDPKKPVLGADIKIPEVPRPAPVEEEEDSGDIFEGVGDYNPLEVVSDSDASSDDEDDNGTERPLKVQKQEASEASKDPPPPTTENVAPQPSAPRNYFGDKPAAEKEEFDPHAGIQDILKKAASMRPLQSRDEDQEYSEGESEETAEARATRLAREKRHKEMLASQNQDFEDMDMGFGGGRFDDDDNDDDDNGDGEPVKLSKWRGLQGGNEYDDGGEEEGEQGGGRGKNGDRKKKRKGKKRKGDANNVEDVMRVIEGRKNEA